MPTRPLRPALGAILGLALGACADVASTIPPRPAPPDAAADAAYPKLVDVPGRPKLTYTPEQRRAIEDRLAAEGDDAVGAAAALRAGRTVPPPRDLEIDRAIAATRGAPATDAPPAGTPAPPPATAGAALPVVPDIVVALQDTAAAELEAAAAAAVAARGAERARRAAEAAARGGAGATATAAPPAPPAAGAGTAITAPSETAVEDRVRDDLDTVDAEGTLGDFLDTLERGQTRRFERGRARQFERGRARQGAAPAPAPPAEPGAKGSAAPATLAEQLAAAPARVDLPPAGPVRLSFPPGAPRPNQAGLALLDRLGAELAAGGSAGKVTIVAAGPSAAAALDRARAVAVRLVRAGLPAGRVEMKLGGTGDAVTIYRPDAGA